MPEITLMVRISSWNFVHVPEARLRAHVQSFSLKFSQEVWFLQYTHFGRTFWRTYETHTHTIPPDVRKMLFKLSYNDWESLAAFLVAKSRQVTWPNNHYCVGQTYSLQHMVVYTSCKWLVKFYAFQSDFMFEHRASTSEYLNIDQ